MDSYKYVRSQLALACVSTCVSDLTAQLYIHIHSVYKYWIWLFIQSDFERQVCCLCVRTRQAEAEQINVFYTALQWNRILLIWNSREKNSKSIWGSQWYCGCGHKSINVCETLRRGKVILVHYETVTGQLSRLLYFNVAHVFTLGPCVPDQRVVSIGVIKSQMCLWSSLQLYSALYCGPTLQLVN